MGKTPAPVAVLAITLLYFCGAAFTCMFARTYNGIAVVWVPGAVLAAWLYACERKDWTALLIGCGLANELAAGWFGMGWAPGLGLSVANVAEAVAAAELSRFAFRTHWPRATFEMVSVFLLGVLLVIPAGSALIAATCVRLATHAVFVDVFRQWMLGHAVGLVAVLPFALIAVIRAVSPAWFVNDRRRGEDTPAEPHHRVVSVLMVCTMMLLTVCVFVQDAAWPLAAPLLFALFAAVWADVLIATAMPMLVALTAGPLTGAGLGPFAAGLVPQSDRLQAGVLYAGLVACCSLPVVVEQARRRIEIARLARSAAHFQAMSQRADSLIDALRRDALTDPLTGLPNRRAFYDALMRQAASGETACVAMIDIDHFKRVNDRLGHAAGDAVLARFADIARSSFRGDDLVARIGGEEFAVILRAVTIEQACMVCQRLTDRLAASEIATPFGPVGVTISSGIAPVGSDGEAAMAAADSALYEAKRAGRSRLSSAA
jgi:diguanylate cyclase (GGDEF)-like protein